MANARVVTAVLGAFVAGCSPYGGAAFTCQDSNQCGGSGVCQDNGRCSFPDSTCTSGQRYGDHAGDDSGVCVGDEGGGDAGTDGPIASSVCYGATDGLLRPCFPTAPLGDLVLPAQIDTDTSALCSTTVTDADGTCVIAANHIELDQLVSVTGSKPLVLVAVASIEIGVTLDVASHRDPAKTGPGANPAGGCTAGSGPPPSGGGPGGSFGGKGGDGGNSGNNSGKASDPVAVTAFRGGCPGTNGRSGTPGTGGAGGGALYLIAGTSIVVSGTINASGAAGTGATNNDGGGGGGGAGGMLVFDAQTIDNSGQVFANGGSGGEGASITVAGSPGVEPTDVNETAAPVDASQGGNGGRGAGIGSPGDGKNGRDGGGAFMRGGGGGGGGVGVIRVFGAALGGPHSPAPS